MVFKKLKKQIMVSQLYSVLSEIICQLGKQTRRVFSIMWNLKLSGNKEGWDGKSDVKWFPHIKILIRIESIELMYFYVVP